MLARRKNQIVLAALAITALVAIALAPRPSMASGGSQVQLRANLVNAGVDTDAKARADFRERSGLQTFKVSVQRLNEGTYDVLVAGMMHGQIVTDSKGKDELQFKTNPEPGEDALPLTFDPRGQLVEIKQGSTLFLSVAFPSSPAGGGGGGTGISIDVKANLANTGALPGAKGYTEFRSDGSRSRFKVEIEKVPSGSYDVRVEGNVVGTISVATSFGEVEFDTQIEPGKLPLTFDPHGKLVEVLQNGTVILQVVFPN